MCPQPCKTSFDCPEGVKQDEDCLYLNIYAPPTSEVNKVNTAFAYVVINCNNTEYSYFSGRTNLSHLDCNQSLIKLSHVLAKMKPGSYIIMYTQT